MSDSVNLVSLYWLESHCLYSTINRELLWLGSNIYLVSFSIDKQNICIISRQSVIFSLIIRTQYTQTGN